MTIELVGWTLINSVWQGGVIAILLAATLHLMRHASASARYAAGVAALAAMIVTPIASTIFGRETAPGVMSSVTAAPASLASASTARGATPTMPTLSRIYASSDGPTVRAIVWRLDAALSWIVAGWLVGIVALSVRLIGGVARSGRLAHDGIEMPDARLGTMAQSIADRLGIHTAIRILKSTRVDVPMVVGLAAPVVLVPASLLTGLAPAQLEMLLAHELAHVRRYDTIVNFAQRIVETLLFFHPAAWWIPSCVRDERENCCDDIAIEITGADRVSYGATLLMVEEFRGATPILATAATDGSLLRRVRRLLRRAGHHSHADSRWLPSITAIVTVLIVAGSIDARAFSRGTDRTIAKPGRATAATDSQPTTTAFTTPDSSHRNRPMLRHPVLIGAASLAVASASVTARSKPTFAGKWTLVGCSGCRDSSDIGALRATNAFGPGWGADVTIIQDDANLTIEDDAPGVQKQTVYSLTEPKAPLVTKGSDGLTRISFRISDLTMVQSKAAWHADTLIVPLIGTRDSTISISFSMTLFIDGAGQLIAKWKVGELRYKSDGVHLDFSFPSDPSAFKGSNDTITLRYQKL